MLLAVYLLVTLAAVASEWVQLDLPSRLLHDPASLLIDRVLAALVVDG